MLLVTNSREDKSIPGTNKVVFSEKSHDCHSERASPGRLSCPGHDFFPQSETPCLKHADKMPVYETVKRLREEGNSQSHNGLCEPYSFDSAVRAEESAPNQDNLQKNVISQL